jgi:hypothetical protein
VDETVTMEGPARSGDVVSRSRVTRVAREMPPADALLIPAGAKQVESHLVETQRRMQELDTLPPVRGRP